VAAAPPCPAGTPFAGEYIVIYKENEPDVELAAER
jgi:hypothetical protein